MTLYVVRTQRHSDCVLESTPCEDCIRTIRLLDLKKVVYVDGSGDIVCQRPKDLPDGARSAGKRFLQREGLIQKTASLQSAK
jgi:hypothetical protein